MDDTVICFTEVRFLQTYSPLRWSQRSGLFQPFPSLKRSVELETRIEEEEKQSKRKSSKRTQMSLSLVTNLFGVIPDLGEDLISLFVSWNEF
jgi:hypothetical protein